MKKLSLMAVAIFGITILSACTQGPTDGTLDDFATCVKDAGITLYAQDGCGHCITQENLFGTSFEKLNSINCSIDGDKCGAIKGTPTRVLPNAEQLGGVQSLETIAEVSGCKLPVENKEVE